MNENQAAAADLSEVSRSLFNPPSALPISSSAHTHTPPCLDKEKKKNKKIQ